MPGVRVTLGVMRQVSWAKAACHCSRQWSVLSPMKMVPVFGLPARKFCQTRKGETVPCWLAVDESSKWTKTCFVAPFEGMVAMQVGDFIGEIELVLWSAHTDFSHNPPGQSGREDTTDLQCTSSRPAGARIYAVPLPAGYGLQEFCPNLQATELPELGARPSPQVIHPVGIRSPGPSSRIFGGAPETQSCPSRVDNYCQLLSFLSKYTRSRQNGASG